MASKIKNRGTRTATETNADILERIGGSGGAAFRSSRSKRPDILKLKKQSKPLTTKSDAAKMVRANKASKFNKPEQRRQSAAMQARRLKQKKENYAGRAGVVARKAAKVGAAATLVAVGYGANQWINQKPAKKK